jgi:hypothetical protein
MDASSSIRFCSRAPRSRERGYALIAAMVLAVLYFGLVQLMLLDSARELAEARRYRSMVLAQTLAENAAELAAEQIAVPTRSSATAKASDWQGSMEGEMRKNGAGNFDIEAEGRTTGLFDIKRKVLVRGRVVETSPGRFDVRIQYTIHTP